MSRLVFEPLAHEHARGLVDALAHPEVATYLPAPDVTTEAALHERIDHLLRGSPDPSEDWINVVVLHTGIVIGRLEATRVGTWAEIAYLIGPAYQRRGFGREAVQWLIDHLRALGVAELWACIHPRNAASIALVESLGFTRVASTDRPLASYDPGDAIYTA